MSSSPSSTPTSAMETLQSQTSSLSLTRQLPPMTLTENNSATFLNTGNPCLDFFFHVVPDTPHSDLIQRLDLAWRFDPLTTLKLICNLRGVRGTGKSDKEGFYGAALWLFQNHPKTLTLNLKTIALFGYLKDMPEILYRLLEGVDCRKIAREEHQRGGGGGGKGKRKRVLSMESTPVKKDPTVVMGKEEARALRKNREAEKLRRANERYNTDLSYRSLHDGVAELFAELLKLDLGFLEVGELNKISLAAKWCPSIDSSYDKATCICGNVAKRVFVKEGDEEFSVMGEEEYVYKARDRLRKKVLTPLRRALELPEVYMSANQWGELKYGRVASVAMKNYKALFEKHDKDRFEQYLEDVKSGKAKIAAGALLPHQIIKSLEDADGGKVLELQWTRMVEDMNKKGMLSNCIAVCDVSGSMSGEPMEVCVALGLLVSELSEEPWKGKVITFSENPQLHEIEGESLEEKTEFIRRMDWGGNTDFQKVFDRLLEVATAGKLTEEQMIQRVFVFSDMEFDQAAGRYDGYNYSYGYGDYSEPRVPRGWETDYEVIRAKFLKHGYNKVPEIVFWNLRASKATPVPSDQPGVALLSGFSKNLLTLFLEAGGIISPVDVMNLAIAGEEYQKLVVYD